MNDCHAWAARRWGVWRWVTRLLWPACFLAPALAAGSEPVRIAVFEFELEDFSPAVATPELAAADAGHLAEVTAAVRDLLSQSGRYEIVDVSAAEDPEVRERSLRDCGGCDAAIARKLGAAQSLVGRPPHQPHRVRRAISAARFRQRHGAFRRRYRSAHGRRLFLEPRRRAPHQGSAAGGRSRAVAGVVRAAAYAFTRSILGS